MQDSIINEAEMKNIENYFILDLKEENNLNKCIETIENFLCNYDENFWGDLKYKSVVNELLKDISKSNVINKDVIKNISKKYNEENNKHLIMKEEKVKKGFLNWILKIFKANPKKEINIDTTAYDNEEKRLANEFEDIAEKLKNYITEVNKLESIVKEESFNNILFKVKNCERINYDLVDLLEKLKLYRNYIDFKQNRTVNEENLVQEEVVNEESLISEAKAEYILAENNLQNDLKSSEDIIDCESIVKENEIVEKNDDEDIHSKILIEEVFSDNIFKIFTNYCNENNLKVLNDLRDFDFNELDKLKGFGVGKKEKLIQRYIEAMGEDYIQDSINNEVAIEPVEIKVQDIYKNLDITILECFNKINGKLIEQIKATDINTIEELYTRIYSNNLSIQNLGSTKVKYIKDALESLEKEPEVLFRFLVDRIKENQDYNILLKRVINNNTLQQIGEEYGVSRERIRQKEKKIVKAVEAVLNIFIGVVDINDTKALSIEEILSELHFNDEEKECLKYVLINKEDSKCRYLEEIDKFLVNGDIDELKAKIVSISNGMPDIVNIKSELIYDLQEYTELNILSLDEVVSMIITLGYKRVNDFLFRGNVSKTKIYNFIVKEFFKSGIKFSSDEDMNKFISILNEKFDIEDDSIRNIKAKVETTCVLCDRGSYIHSEWVDINERLLDDIKEYIDNSSQETLYINQIFSEFEKELNNVGVKNRYYLQGILKYYFSDNYNFTKDTLYKGNVKHDRNYIFNKYIKDKGRPVSKEDVENDLKGWTPIMLTMAEDECKYVLKWDKGGFIHASLIKASLEDINGISKVISNLFNNGKESITDNEALDKLNIRFEKFLNENYIDNGFKLFSVLEYLLGKEYYFRRPYILKDKPKEAVSAVYLMKKLFNNEAKVTLEQLKEFCNDIKLNDSTRMNSISSLLKDTVEIEKETYILKDNFEIDESVIESVRGIILSKVNVNGYVALRGIDDYSIFPKIKYEWNTYILRDICEYYIPEVKELKRQFYDKRYSSPIIVEESSDMNELLDLVIIILKNEFVGEIGVNELSQYLRENNIVYDKIPFEIYNCDEIIVEDNLIMLR